ncbi:hypothetical protein AB0K71_06070 [Streptomyces syringium]|uniref:hypothetical protein n=1 Tax=Streptomyces syringium TaxID=76729 RepID=UPI003426D04C
MAEERDKIQQQLELAEKDRDAERESRRKITRLLAESEVDVRRLLVRVKGLRGQLGEARQAQGGDVARLADRLERVLRACARYREELADARRPRPAPGGSEVERLRRAVRSLAEQLAAVQASNDAMSRELVDRSGILRSPRAADREPGVAS